MNADLPPVAVEAEYRVRLQTYGVPDHLQDGLILYLVYHKRPGSFLAAVLANDLAGALGKADDRSLAGLQSLTRFLFHHCPARAWGSLPAVRAWLDVEVAP